mmetsp:Transcript_25385/g.83462  ORF Transcript_25385/g.83462 Transcript_25385/m.83462 type:complete len:241 (-) Transcript_25385:43-765(-)
MRCECGFASNRTAFAREPARAAKRSTAPTPAAAAASFAGRCLRPACDIGWFRRRRRRSRISDEFRGWRREDELHQSDARVQLCRARGELAPSSGQCGVRHVRPGARNGASGGSRGVAPSAAHGTACGAPCARGCGGRGEQHAHAGCARGAPHPARIYARDALLPMPLRHHRESGCERGRWGRRARDGAVGGDSESCRGGAERGVEASRVPVATARAVAAPNPAQPNPRTNPKTRPTLTTS